MATITEDYVSFETAKLLKEKGFPQSTFRCHYIIDGNSHYKSFENRCGFGDYDIIAPTLAMAMKWLRKEHNICVVSFPLVTDDDGEAGCLWKYVISKKLKTLYNSYDIYESSEFALNNGLKYVLENLI